MIKKYNLLIISALSIFLVLFAALAFFIFNKSQVVYVDNVILFDGFFMTKEMKKVGEKEFTIRKAITDTLYAKLQSSTISEEDKKQLMSEFIQAKEALEGYNKAFGASEVPKIWSRINGYTSDFAKENKYQLIIGSDNKQTVLFADPKIDVTNDLLTYINKKYEGSK